MGRTVVTMIAALAMSAIPDVAAVAQWDPGIVAQGQVLQSMNQGYADRAAGKTAPRRKRLNANETAICKAKHHYRKKWGAQEPHVRQLYRLCAQAGH